MIIYVDLIFFINFMFDFLLLLTVKIVLKRKTKFKRIVLGTLIGALSIFSLFIKMNSITLFIFKVLISMIMALITFGYKDRKYFFKNILYLYFVSIILGGFLYYLNMEFSYKNDGLLFFNNGFSINYILLIILSPIILYLYIKQERELKINNNFYYTVTVFYNNKKYIYNAYLDTGNKLYDPYFKKPVIILYDKNIAVKKPLLIPYNTVNNTGILKGFKPSKVLINDRVIDKPLIIALSSEKLNIDGVDMLLHRDLLL